MPSEEIKQTFICDFDDLAPDRPGLELLIALKEHYPNFKCTCFTPAFNLSVIHKKLSADKFKKWFSVVKELNWIEIAPHGFAHQRGEWNIKDKKKAYLAIETIEKIFKSVNIPFVKVFKFPYWEGSDVVEEVLLEKGYTLAIDRNDPVTYTDIPTYIFNWSIDEPVPKYHTVKSHGHIHDTNNGLNICLENMLKIPTNVNFKTIGEFLCLTNQM